MRSSEYHSSQWRPLCRQPKPFPFYRRFSFIAFNAGVNVRRRRRTKFLEILQLRDGDSCMGIIEGFRK